MSAFITLIIAPGRTLVELDAVLSETHQAEVEVTEHPVELGADVTDHARVKPASVTIEGLVSNTPVNRGQQRRVVSANGVEVETTSVEDALAGAQGYAEDAFAKLNEIKDARQVVTVVTQLKTYKNMLLQSLSVPRDARTGDALRFTATFKEVHFAEVRLREVPVVTREPRTKAKVNTGKQVAAETPEARRKTLGKRFENAFKKPGFVEGLVKNATTALGGDAGGF